MNQERTHATGRSWRDAGGILRTAGLLLMRHWPMMLTAALIGVAFRDGVIWAAVIVSDTLPWLAQLILILAPLGYMLPAVYMLRICAKDLPSLRAVVEDKGTGEQRDQRLLDVAVSVLVPFLAIYTTYNLLAQDRRKFMNTAAADEWRNGLGQDQNYIERLQLLNPIWMVIAIVGFALILRWLLGRVERVWKFVGLAFLGALIELFWTIYVSDQLRQGVDRVTNWVLEREFVVAIGHWWSDLIDALGWSGIYLDVAVGWLFGLFGGIGPVLIVPVAWLVVAAVVLGHQLMPPGREEHPLLQRASTVLPEGVRRVGASFAKDLGGRWAAFFGGIGLLVRTGFVPILIFCALFLIPNLMPTLVSWASRLIFGSMSTSTFLAFAPWETAIGIALQLLLTAPLVAAAIDRFITPASQQAGIQHDEETPSGDLLRDDHEGDTRNKVTA